MIKRIMHKFLILFILFSLLSPTWAVETCSRTALINYQEVLVDTNSNQKGEGLRYYLEKDQIASDYLNKYQEGSHLNWYQAVPGSIGTGMIVAGLISSGGSNKRSLIIGGAALIAVNFLIAKTFEAANEENLQKAVEEYNKRNLPLIHFNDKENQGRPNEGFSPSILLNYSKDF